MSRKCELTGKIPLAGHKVSHANNKVKRRFLPNLKKITFTSELLNKNIKLTNIKSLRINEIISENQTNTKLVGLFENTIVHIGIINNNHTPLQSTTQTETSGIMKQMGTAPDKCHITPGIF